MEPACHGSSLVEIQMIMLEASGADLRDLTEAN
jgi:hypothetical protein